MYSVEYAGEAEDDIDRLRLDDRLEDKLITTVTHRLSTSPLAYGEPLRGKLHGYYKLTFQRWRVIYHVDERGRVVVVCAAGIRAAGDRRNIYDAITREALDDRLARHNMPDAE